MKANRVEQQQDKDENKKKIVLQLCSLAVLRLLRVDPKSVRLIIISDVVQHLCTFFKRWSELPLYRLVTLHNVKYKISEFNQMVFEARNE